jgi:two-component system phosphate regulon sensor histidine kinase PhoR
MADPVSDEGELQGAVLVLLDVTEREDRERLRREFSANVSHELRTPLTTISGYAEILANGVAKLEDAPRFAERIYAEARRLIALVGDVMMLSKLDESGEAGGGVIERGRVGLGELARSAAESLGGIARSRNVSIVLDIPEEVEVTGIRPLLGEMVLNLLDNAVKYNVDGGEVRISAGKVPDARASDAGTPNAETPNGVFLTVADTGVGIPPEEQERVFERFYRVEKSRGGAAKGTGLGLSIVKRGALLHNAKITLQSDGKSGTSVTLLFPAL